MTCADTLIIFVKCPDPGRVKTRLAADTGDTRAAGLYRLFVEALIIRTQSGEYCRAVYFTPEGRLQDIRDWLGSSIDLYPQQGASLGERISSAFHDAFESGARKVVVIGSDSPLLGAGTINTAFSGLETHDCVIGPCTDGGYYLVGLASFRPELFRGIDWSTDRVFAQSMEAVRAARLSCKVLEEHFDVDDAAGLQRLRGALDGPAEEDCEELMAIRQFLEDRCL